jgi:hypothetical protein
MISLNDTIINYDKQEGVKMNCERCKVEQEQRYFEKVAEWGVKSGLTCRIPDTGRQCEPTLKPNPFFGLAPIETLPQPACKTGTLEGHLQEIRCTLAESNSRAVDIYQHLFGTRPAEVLRDDDRPIYCMEDEILYIKDQISKLYTELVNIRERL